MKYGCWMRLQAERNIAFSTVSACALNVEGTS
jgi:hypothetical protein